MRGKAKLGAAAIAVAAFGALPACGGGASPRPPAPAPRPPRARTDAATTRSPTPRAWRVTAKVATHLPAPVQLPGLAAIGSTVIATGGLDAADASVASIVRVAPGAPARIGALPQAAHDAGAATFGRYAYTLGGGTASGPTDSIVRVGPSGSAGVAGRLPVAMSDTSVATLGGTIYAIGGYTTSVALRSVLAFRPGSAVRDVATLPHPLRYAAVAAIAGRILVAGGTDGITARREVLSIDPATGRVRVVARLPRPLAHAAGAALDGRFLVIGGRGDARDSQRRGIWAIDPSAPRPHPAGRLPVALSDLSAVSVGDHVLVAGGRDPRGGVHDEVLELRGTAGARAATTHARHADRIPPLLDPRNVYAADRPGNVARVAAHDPARVYVPNSGSDTVDVIDQHTGRVVEHFATGQQPQHVTPSWDLRTLWVTNDRGGSLTPIDPRTGHPGRPVAVSDPYNLYFTADGSRAIVVAEARRELDFRAPHSMRLLHALSVPQCPGVDHMDYTADGRAALVSCEFGARMLVVDLVHERTVRTISLRAGAMPQDVKLSPDGRTFYVADMTSNGVWLIDARTWRVLRLQPTGAGAHGLYPSRDGRLLYVSNRGEGSITVLSCRTRRPIGKWRLPGGGSPDMGGVSADGRVLWLTGRYNAELYAISTRTGRLLRRVRVGSGPHGAAVWPQPGRYSIGHTGILR
jgi:YVTN family beta-propeller protein